MSRAAGIAAVETANVAGLAGETLLDGCRACKSGLAEEEGRGDGEDGRKLHFECSLVRFLWNCIEVGKLGVDDELDSMG